MTSSVNTKKGVSTKADIAIRDKAQKEIDALNKEAEPLVKAVLNKPAVPTVISSQNYQLPSEALKYIRHLRNLGKKDYATRYAHWLLQEAQGAEPQRGKLSEMAAQAVRTELDKMATKPKAEIQVKAEPKPAEAAAQESAEPTRLGHPISEAESRAIHAWYGSHSGKDHESPEKEQQIEAKKPKHSIGNEATVTFNRTRVKGSIVDYNPKTGYYKVRLGLYTPNHTEFFSERQIHESHKPAKSSKNPVSKSAIIEPNAPRSWRFLREKRDLEVAGVETPTIARARVRVKTDKKRRLSSRNLGAGIVETTSKRGRKRHLKL